MTSECKKVKNAGWIKWGKVNGPYGDSSHSTSAHHCSPLLRHACVLLFYDHAITIFTILMTHMISYLSLTLPGLSLNPHSFDCSFLSCLCYLHSARPTLFVIILSLPKMRYLQSYSSVMATLVYIVVAVRCSSLAL